MTNRLHVEAQLLRLSAAYPTFRMAGPTQELYLQKLLPLDPGDFGNAVEYWIEHGGRYPSIGQLVQKAREFESSRLEKQKALAEESSRRDRLERADFRVPGVRFSDPEIQKHFRYGQEHARRTINRLSLDGCPCMECQGKIPAVTSIEEVHWTNFDEATPL